MHLALFSVCDLKGKAIEFHPHLLCDSGQHEKSDLSAAGRAKEGGSHGTVAQGGGRGGECLSPPTSCLAQVTPLGPAHAMPLRPACALAGGYIWLCGFRPPDVLGLLSLPLRTIER